MPKIKVNDVNLYYEIHGQGQPIVCISGFTGDHNGWGAVVEGLAQNYQVITFDNRGIGQSDCPDYPYTVEMMAEDVTALMQALHLGKVHLIGNSMGGSIVQTIAYRHPELVKSMVLANSFIKAHGRLTLHVHTRLALMKLNFPIPAEVIIHELLLWVYSSRYLGQPGVADRLTKAALTNPVVITIEGYEHQLNALLTFDSQKWLHKINAPCLVINADDDLLASHAEGRQMAKIIPQAQYFCFKNVGHMPQLECPEDFKRLVLKFIAKHDKRNFRI